VSDLSRLGWAYLREAARLLDTYPNARAQGQFHSLDDMIVKDLARTYPMATGREVQQAMVEGSPHHYEQGRAPSMTTHAERCARRGRAWAASPSRGCARSGTAAAARGRGGTCRRGRRRPDRRDDA